MAQVYKEPLATIGRRIHHTFKVLEDTNMRDHPDMALENESQRFELWAVNLGLYHHGHSSLDYRFRDAPSVFSFAYKLLQDLEKYLELIKDTLDDEHHQLEASRRQIGIALDQSDCASVAPTTSICNDNPENDCSSDEDSEDEESFDSYQAQLLTGLAVENTGQVIDRLYRLSFKIRNPATRMGFTKAQDFRELDQDTGIDLIETFAAFDRKHVEEVFIHYRPELNPEEVAKQFLVQRLAKANTRRRQQFGQWRRHKTKLQRVEKPALKLEGFSQAEPQRSQMTQILEAAPVLGTTASSKPSTATWLDHNKIALDDDMSIFSTSTYAIFSHELDAELPVPQLPKKLREKKEFQCPYCYVLCSRRTAEKQAWKTHVQRDLRPYVCTYSGCKEADQQYDSFKQWVAHEAQAHGAVSRRLKHPTKGSSFLVSSNAHREAQNRDDFSSLFEEDPAPLEGNRQCPICLETPVSSNHIGLHLWNIAVFALPRSTGVDDDSDNGSTGSVVNDRQSQVSRLTNMNNLEPLSIDEEQENHAAAIADDTENHEAAHLTTDALKDIPNSLQNGVAVNVSDYILFGQTTGDKEKALDFDHRSISDSSGNPDIPLTIMKAEETLERYQNTLDLEHMARLHAIALYERARLGYERELGPEHVKTVNIVRVGHAYARQGKLAEAEEMLQRALKDYEKALGPEHIVTLDTIIHLSLVYEKQKRYSEAEEMYRRALQGYEKRLGPEHEPTIQTVTQLGHMYERQDKWAEAEKMYQRALKSYEKILGPEHETTIQAVTQLGYVYTSQDKFAEAKKMQKRALKSYEKILGPEHETTIQAVIQLGFVYRLQGKFEEAEKTYLRALKSYGALEDSGAQGSQYRQTIIILYNLGEVYRLQDKFGEAEKMYQRALKNLDALKGSKTRTFKPPWMMMIARPLGDIYKEQGRLVEAEEMEEMYQRAQQSEELLKARDTGHDDGDDEDEDVDDDFEDVGDDDDGKDKGDDE